MLFQADRITKWCGKIVMPGTFHQPFSTCSFYNLPRFPYHLNLLYDITTNLQCSCTMICLPLPFYIVLYKVYIKAKEMGLTIYLLGHLDGWLCFWIANEATLLIFLQNWAVYSKILLFLMAWCYGGLIKTGFGVRRSWYLVEKIGVIMRPWHGRSLSWWNCTWASWV